MDAEERLRRNLAFYSAYSAVRKRGETDENVRIRIGDAIEIFNDVERSLESILNPERGFFITDDLKPIIGAIGGQLDKAFPRDISLYIEKIKGYCGWLDSLRGGRDMSANSGFQKVYDSFKQDLKKLSDFYSENHRVFKCE